MKNKFTIALAAVIFAASLQVGCAQEQPKAEATSTLPAERKEIIAQIKEKLKAGKKQESDLAENFRAIDALIAKHRADSQEEVAGLYILKANVYSQALDNDAQAEKILLQLKKDFPGSKAAEGADEFLKQIKAQAAAKAIQRTLVPGNKFPAFAETNLLGKPLALADFKGKVVLIDFWATWCPPCRAELPNVLKVYEANRAKGFEVIGISLDSDRARLDKYIADKGLAWPQYFDGKGWGNKLAAKYGITSIPATFLLDREGKIIATDVRGEELGEAVAKAVATK